MVLEEASGRTRAWILEILEVMHPLLEALSITPCVSEGNKRLSWPREGSLDLSADYNFHSEIIHFLWQFLSAHSCEPGTCKLFNFGVSFRSVSDSFVEFKCLKIL